MNNKTDKTSPYVSGKLDFGNSYIERRPDTPRVLECVSRKLDFGNSCNKNNSDSPRVLKFRIVDGKTGNSNLSSLQDNKPKGKDFTPKPNAIDIHGKSYFRIVDDIPSTLIMKPIGIDFYGNTTYQSIEISRKTSIGCSTPYSVFSSIRSNLSR